jgi:prolipoprotein diacylglyceryltransferase
MNRKERTVKARRITMFLTLTALAAALAPIAEAAGRWG